MASATISCWVKGRTRLIFRSAEARRSARGSGAGTRTFIATKGGCSASRSRLGWGFAATMTSVAGVTAGVPPLSGCDKGFAGATFNGAFGVCGFGVPSLMMAKASGGRVGGRSAALMLRRAVWFIGGELFKEEL